MAPFGKGSKHTLETRERQSRVRLKQEATKREARRQAAQDAARAAIAAPADLRRFEELGIVAESLEPHVQDAALEAADLIQALGGEGEISAQRRVVVQDLSRLRVLLSAELGRYIRKPDGNAATRIVSIVNSRRSSLQALGLEHHERDVSPVDEYALALEAARQVPATSDEEGGDQ